MKQNVETNRQRKARIAILRWEEGKVPEGLMQLEAMPGNSTNPASYPFPVKQAQQIGAIVLECTDLPPFARKISQAVGLPVFDFVSMMGHVAMSLGEVTFY